MVEGLLGRFGLGHQRLNLRLGDVQVVEIRLKCFPILGFFGQFLGDLQRRGDKYFTLGLMWLIN